MEQIVEKYGIVTIRWDDDGTIIYSVNTKITYFDSVIDLILRDDNIEEIMYNGQNQPVRVFHHKYGMCITPLIFAEAEVEKSIEEIAHYNRKSINEERPILDGVLQDGSRVNIIIPPASLAISLTIRKFKHTALTVLELIRDKSVSAEIAAFLWTCMSRLGNPANILFIGGTATGKTTALSAFSVFIKQKERVIIIEDTPEIQLRQPNIVRLISNQEHSIDMDMLLKNALRMRPDRIIVGEVRGREALTLFSAMNTGHEGCLGTLHANSAKECVSRITNPPMSVPVTMLGALHLVVVFKRKPSGERYVQEISEISGVDSEGARFNKVFGWSPDTGLCARTGVPSRLKAKIADESGLTITDIDQLIETREKKLEELVSRNASPEQLIAVINKADKKQQS